LGVFELDFTNIKLYRNEKKLEKRTVKRKFSEFELKKNELSKLKGGLMPAVDGTHGGG
jgi:hypothetical protein